MKLKVGKTPPICNAERVSLIWSVGDLGQTARSSLRTLELQIQLFSQLMDLIVLSVKRQKIERNVANVRPYIL